MRSIGKPKKKQASFTIREDILRDARELGLNASQEAEKGLYEAVREAKKHQYQEQNKEAFKNYNEWVLENGLPITPAWAKDFEDA